MRAGTGSLHLAARTIPPCRSQIKQMVDAICHGDDDPLLREQAVVIAESQLWLSCIGWEKLAPLHGCAIQKAFALTGRYNRQGLAKIKAKSICGGAPVDIADAQAHRGECPDRRQSAAGRRPRARALPAALEAAWPPAFLKARKRSAMSIKCCAKEYVILSAYSAMRNGHGRGARGLFARSWRSN